MISNKFYLPMALGLSLGGFSAAAAPTVALEARMLAEMAAKIHRLLPQITVVTDLAALDNVTPVHAARRAQLSGEIDKYWAQPDASGKEAVTSQLICQGSGPALVYDLRNVQGQVQLADGTPAALTCSTNFSDAGNVVVPLAGVILLSGSGNQTYKQFITAIDAFNSSNESVRDNGDQVAAITTTLTLTNLLLQVGHGTLAFPHGSTKSVEIVMGNSMLIDSNQ